MKKIYINPTIEVMKIEAMHILAGSEKMQSNGTYTNSVNLGSRQASQWGDDDEE